MDKRERIGGSEGDDERGGLEGQRGMMRGEDWRVRGVHSHQTLEKVVRGKNLDVYEGYFGMVVRGI